VGLQSLGSSSSGLRPRGLWHPEHLQQLHFHEVTDEVGVLAALTALQVVGGDGEGHGGGVQGTLQPLLLGQQQVGLGGQLAHLLLQLRLPAVRVLQPRAHLPGGVLLRAPGQSLRLRRQLLALVALLLRLVAVGEGLVVAGIAVLEPLVCQVLGRAEAGGGQARGRVGTCVPGHIVQLLGQLEHVHLLHGAPRPCSPGEGWSVVRAAVSGAGPSHSVPSRTLLVSQRQVHTSPPVAGQLVPSPRGSLKGPGSHEPQHPSWTTCGVCPELHGDSALTPGPVVPCPSYSSQGAGPPDTHGGGPVFEGV
uniref:Uncharacterized protein n=1 Tax=Neovison vison TaxID=452646 RepID=A0A8C7BE00_NEOVI